MPTLLGIPATEAAVDGVRFTDPWRLWLSSLFRVQAIHRTFAWDVASVAANATAEQTVTVPGLEVGMVVVVNKPSHSSGLIVGNARVSAADTLAVTFANITGSPIDPAEETWSLAAWRP